MSYTLSEIREDVRQLLLAVEALEDGPLRVSDGSASAPAYSFANDHDLGIHRFGANDMRISAGNDYVAEFRQSGVHMSFENGSVSAPSIHFEVDADTGIYRPGANQLGFSGGNFQSILINANTDLRAQGINQTTTGSAANVFINSTSGLLARSTSSLRYKQGWEFVDEDALADLELPAPITWTETIEDELEGTVETQTYLGFGTEHIHEMLPAATQDEKNGAPENYDVRSLVAILAAKVKKQQKTIDDLTARIEALEAAK